MMPPFEFIQCSLDYKVIPIDWGCHSYHKITFEGWNHLILNVNDDTFIQVFNIISGTFCSFVSNYMEKFAFTEPLLTLSVEGNVYLKFGMMPIKEYNERMEKDEQRKSKI